MKSISLGYTPKPGEDYPMSVGIADQKEAPKEQFPSLYIDRAPEELQGLPDEGTATIKFRVTERTEREQADGSKKHRLELEVQSISPSGMGNGLTSGKKEWNDGDKVVSDYFAEKDEAAGA